jgi:6-pyruvoyltetrahydropterin/6-carboxytetrahydropterin synthase
VHIEITRRVEFDAGHRVFGHESKCGHLHGHRYVVDITVTAPGLDSVGRVIDFSVVKTLAKDWIDKNWDHNVILFKEDPLRGVTWHYFDNRDPFIMEANPTAENMAKLLSSVLIKLLPAPITLVQVRLYETPNCYADFTP